MAYSKKVFTDMLWSVSALTMMHGVLQIVVYPCLNRYLGAERFGDVLYILAVLGILAPSIGLAANNTRLIQRNEITVGNGDLLLAMIPQFAAAAFIFVFVLLQNSYGMPDILLLLITLILTMLRCYGDVEYRMTLDYKGCFLYYLLISAGYLFGVVLFPLTQNWIICFLLGELFCFLLLAVTGHIYWPLTLTENRRRIFCAALVLSGSYLLDNTVLYLDRVLLQNLMDSASVTVFYVSSLMGKTAALLVVPLNGVMIGYLTKSETQITGKQFAGAFGAAVAIGGILYGGILLVTPLFTRLFYSEISDAVLEIAWLANLSQILCFIASPMLTVMLTLCSSKWQLIIQSIYAAVFIPLGVLGAKTGGLRGFIWAGLAVNTVRLILLVTVGFIQIGKKKQAILQ